MENPDWQQATLQEVDVLWDALATLASLTRVEVGWETKTNSYMRTVDPSIMVSFYNSVSKDADQVGCGGQYPPHYEFKHNS